MAHPHYATLVPFEFNVLGKPVSHQTKNKQRLSDWKKIVRAAAAAHWSNNPPLGIPVRVIITHYFDTPDGDESSVSDSDNIVKPVRDALNGLIYVDDYQITDFVSRRRNLNHSFRVKGMSTVLAEGFCQGEEFLHVKVEEAPDPSDVS
ncbi:MAG: RusA family crossover junction endodeoxyribonuclease [Leptolyngbyaceae bacterium]|nr:RusA family crossover junction endodeoxyribonuclease [Leptolyngbyaceae bacterium]